MELKICHMYPDVLNLYGDRGNVICMRSRLERRGIDCAVTRLPIGSAASLAGFDLVFIGGGQDFEQQVLLDDLAADYPTIHIDSFSISDRPYANADGEAVESSSFTVSLSIFLCDKGGIQP